MAKGVGASGGGVKTAKPMMGYSKPQGPSSIEHRGVGLGGENHGNKQRCDYPSGGSGKPGLGGTKHGNKGSQRC